MKAHEVKHLDPEGELGDQLERIVRTRTDELHAFMPKAGDPKHVTHLHDMRIAAKRLRYILEIAAESFGPYAVTAVKRIRELQDLLGEIHDCDVSLPRVLELTERARAEDVAVARRRAAGDDDLRPRLASGCPNAQAYRGLAALATYYEARRGLLFDQFLATWEGLLRDGFRARLEYAAAERPAAPERSHDGHAEPSAGVLASAPPIS